MDNPQHTRRPWSVGATQCTHDHPTRFWRTIVVSRREAVAQTFGATQDEAEEIARLLATAPHLLSAGEAVCEAWDRYWSGGRSEADAVEFVKAISAQREILAAATGSTYE